MDCIDPLGWSSDYNLVDACDWVRSPRISCDGDENAEFDNDADLHIQTGHMYPSSLVEPEPPAASFESSIVDGNALHAASVLVAQAAFQSPNTSAAILPLPNIMLFLSCETCDVVRITSAVHSFPTTYYTLYPCM
jgi:hypothetical protein